MTAYAQTSFNLKRASLLISALLLLGVPALASTDQAMPPVLSTISGYAIVVDGDTIDIDGQRIRLEGIDAPETAQTCSTTSGSSWPCGRAAAKALTALVAAGDVACDSTGNDKYGRFLGICYTDGRDINAVMIDTGMAWAFTRYSTLYATRETAARAAKIGVWQGTAEAPWDYRHKGWQVSEVAAPQGCAIKGNISHSGQIYHMPWSPWYDKVKVEASRGERWFCSEADAIAAGWRPAATY